MKMEYLIVSGFRKALAKLGLVRDMEVHRAGVYHDVEVD